MESQYIYEYNGCRIDYNGNGYDSLLELRYAIFIQDEYDFIREGINIYFDPAQRKSTNYIREGTRKYKPDFLLRHRVTGKAFLVEVKPADFDDFATLSLYRDVCKHYIAANNYDWEYTIVFSNDFRLPPKQDQLYEAIISNKILYAQHFHCNTLDQRKYTQNRHRQAGAAFTLYMKRNKVLQ